MKDSENISGKHFQIFRNSTKNSQFYEEQHNLIKQEWKKFITGSNVIDNNCIPHEHLASWKRCRKSDIDPFSKPKHLILKGSDLKKLLHENQELLNASRSFLLQLYHYTKKSLVAVGICNAKGYLLDTKTEPLIDDLKTELNWCPGVLWTEADAGNTIVSTVLQSRKPAWLFGPQHYKKRFHYISASGAPITGPSGTLLGAVFLTGFYSNTTEQDLGMVVATAQAVENQLKASKALADSQQAFSEAEFAANCLKTAIFSIPEALIVIDDKSRISMINEKAREKFVATRRSIEGEPIQSILSGSENAPLLKFIRENESFSDIEVRIFSRGEQKDYMLTGNPVLTSSGKKVGKVIIFSEIKKPPLPDNKLSGARAPYRFSDIQGHNKQFQGVIEQARTVSRSSSNVLMLGESGTGKDIVAQAIHNASPRMDGPYVAINCAAIPRDLIASELFGYSEGSFTGSRRGGREGKFELADGGTIFLDEIAETPLELQAVLLRVIEEKAVVRIGEGRVRSVDVRIISATNKDLIEEVSKGHFRKDLYYRLNVFAISIPPLRERTDDIPLLVETFVQKYSATLNKKITKIDKKIWGIFMNHAWPGNVRELQNVVERMINYTSAGELTVDLIPPEILHSRTRRRHETLESPEESEKKMIRHLLTLKFRKNQIAERLNMSRVTLFRKIRKYGLTDLAQD